MNEFIFINGTTGRDLEHKGILVNYESAHEKKSILKTCSQAQKALIQFHLVSIE